MEALKKYPWPGNIRELMKLSERLSQNLNGVIDLNAIKTFLKATPANANAMEGWEEHVLQYGLRSYINYMEKKAVEESMKRNSGKITACIKELKISSSAFYRILQDHQLHF